MFFSRKKPPLGDSYCPNWHPLFSYVCITVPYSAANTYFPLMVNINNMRPPWNRVLQLSGGCSLGGICMVVTLCIDYWLLLWRLQVTYLISEQIPFWAHSCCRLGKCFSVFCCFWSWIGFTKRAQKTNLVFFPHLCKLERTCPDVLKRWSRKREKSFCVCINFCCLPPAADGWQN